MKKKWLKWAFEILLALGGLGLGGTVVALVHTLAPRWLFWVAVFFYLQAVLGSMVRIWMTRPGYEEKERRHRPGWQPPVPQAPRRLCPACGQPVAGDDLCCRFCGARLE